MGLYFATLRAMDTSAVSPGVLTAALVGTPALCALIVLAGAKWIAGMLRDIKALGPTQRSPPIEEELARDYAKRSELLAFREEWRNHCAAQHRQMTDTLDEIFKIMRDADTRNAETDKAVQRMIGILEGKIAVMHGGRK